MFLQYNKGVDGEKRWEMEKDLVLAAFKRRDENTKFGGFFICDRCGRAKAYRYESNIARTCMGCANV